MQHIAINEALDGKAVDWLEQVDDAPLKADLARVDAAVAEAERGGARSDAQPPDLGQHVQQLFGKSIGKVLVLNVATQTDEWQHRDRRPVDAVAAEVTVCFHGRKLGTAVEPGRGASGRAALRR